MQPESEKGRAEFFFKNLQIFLHAMIIYLCAFMLAIGAMLDNEPLAQRLGSHATLGVLSDPLAWVVHTGGLLFRMWLERRPPVTNLYSSAIFIGWMAAC